MIGDNIRTKKIIIDSVIKLIKTKDLQEITVQAICEDTGVSKGTFYHYFKDKYDVLHVFYNDFLIENHIMDNELIRFDEDIYKIQWKKVIHFFKENNDLMKILFNTNYQNSFFEYWTQYLNPKSYKPALQRNHLTDNVSNHYLIFGVIEAQTFVMEQWVMNDCDLSEEEILDLLESFEQILKLN